MSGGASGILVFLGFLAGCTTPTAEPAAFVSGLSADGSGRTSTMIGFRHGTTTGLDDLQVTVEETTGDGVWTPVPDVEVHLEGAAQHDLVLVADNSGSESGKLREIQDAARSVADEVYAMPDDPRLGLVRVSSEARIVQNLTPSAIQFDAAVDQLFVNNGWTALWDGVRQASEVLEQNVVTRDTTSPNTCVDDAFRSVVVLTDGRDNNSADEHATDYPGDGIDTRLADLLGLEVFGGTVPVSVVAVGWDIDEPSLRDLSGAAGGTYTSIDDFSMAESALLHVAEEASGAIPLCFDTSADTTAVRVTLEERGRELIRQELQMPSDGCAVDPDWQAFPPPLASPPACPSDAISSSTLDDAVAIADLGCQVPGAPFYTPALQSDAAWVYAPPTDSERALLAANLPTFFADLVAGADTSWLAPVLQPAGLDYHEIIDPDGTAWVVLSDALPTWRGAGGYIFRKGPVEHELVMQAPHSYYEPGTNPIARTILQEHSVRGFFFNTLHRYYLLPGSACTGVHPADVTHVTNSFFHQLTTEYLHVEPNGTVVQLHGFSNPELEVLGVGTVVSDGTSTPGDRILDLDATLGSTFAGSDVALFPNETPLYGATMNIQGRWMRDEDKGRFVHIEMSRAVRDVLATDADAQSELAAALVTPL